MFTDIQKKLVVLVGLPASGKSTFRSDVTQSDTYHYSTDDCIDEMAREYGITYNEAFPEWIELATKASDLEVNEAIAAGYHVVWDQTNMTRKKRAKILRLFDDTYTKHCVTFLPPFTDEQEEELARRLGSRPGKNIPGYVLRSMRNSFQLPSVDEGFDKIWFHDIYGVELDRNRAAVLFGSA